MTDDQTAAAQWAALWEMYMHENRALRARAEAAEAEAERLRTVITKAVDDLPEWSDGALKHLSPAEAMADEVRMALRAAVTR